MEMQAMRAIDLVEMIGSDLTSKIGGNNENGRMDYYFMQVQGIWPAKSLDQIFRSDAINVRHSSLLAK
jgi:hypothetical protein